MVYLNKPVSPSSRPTVKYYNNSSFNYTNYNGSDVYGFKITVARRQLISKESLK